MKYKYDDLYCNVDDMNTNDYIFALQLIKTNKLKVYNVVCDVNNELQLIKANKDTIKNCFIITANENELIKKSKKSNFVDYIDKLSFEVSDNFYEKLCQFDYCHKITYV